MNEQLIDIGRGVTLCYETFGDRSKPPVLLLMGLGVQMTGWHENFCQRLADEGFFVVRYDNRDIGKSTHFDFPTPTPRQLLLRRFSPEQYTVDDMAADAAELLRRLNLAPAHLVGVSMGGMIAQNLAGNHPELARSLVSIMSSTGARLYGNPSFVGYKALLTPLPGEREAVINRAEKVFRVVGSPGFETDYTEFRERVGLAFDRETGGGGTNRQLAAILKSGDRTEILHKIKVPATVIHGKQDKLVSTSGGKATAREIAGARLMLIEGMGHDMAPGLWPIFIEAIASQARAADHQAGANPAAAA